MGVGLAVAAVALSAGSAYMSYKGQKDQADAQRREARKQAERAQEREAREKRIRQEQIDYESALAMERAEWETDISLEKAEFTSERIQEEADMVKAAQIAGYAASGLSLSEGSPLVVMARTSKISETEKESVMRGHDIFSEARMKEAEEVKKGGEATYEWFRERLHAETGYEVESRLAEASMYKKKASGAQYGGYLSVGSSLLSAAGSFGGGGGAPGTTGVGGGFGGSPSLGGSGITSSEWFTKSY